MLPGHHRFASLSLSNNTIKTPQRQLSEKSRVASRSFGRYRHRNTRTLAASQAEEALTPPALSTPTQSVLDTIGAADAFCFDVDSTFCADESIDELAAFLGVGDKVASLTAQAMGGTVSFQDALAQRLGCMQPSREAVARYLQCHPPLISPGIPELLQALRSKNKHIFLVSGGFRAIIDPIAQSLDIPLENVFANTILFDPITGDYEGFDTNEFTSRSGGKEEAVAHIKSSRKLQCVIMVGDGATDAEAKRPGGADLFIGYGGVVVRPPVVAAADWYVMTIGEITEAVLLQ